MLNYKEDGELPEDSTRAKKVKNLAPQFTVVNNELYKKAKSGPLLKYVTPEEAEYILREIHEGVCGHHQGARSLAHRAFRAWYYLPNTLSDAEEVVKKCEKRKKKHRAFKAGYYWHYPLRLGKFLRFMVS